MTATSSAVIAAVMNRARATLGDLDVPWSVGRAAKVAHAAAPRVDWVPVSGTHGGPQLSGHNPRPIANRRVTFAVRCWGVDVDQAEQLLEAVVRGAHLQLTRGGYELGGEEWPESGVVTSGVAVVLTLTLGLPILDLPQPTARPTHLATDGAPSP